MGAPNALNFRGMVIVKEIARLNKYEHLPMSLNNSICRFKLENSREKSIDRGCTSLSKPFSYMGMSVVFIKNSQSTASRKPHLIASGAPREDLYGMVRLLSLENKNSKMNFLNVTLMGDSMYSYFGFSLAIADIDNDGYHDQTFSLWL